MNKVKAFYIVLSLTIAFIDFYLALISIKDNKVYSKVVFGALSVNAGMVAIFYMLSVLLKDYLIYSILTSIYFILIDTLLLSFLIFISVYIANLDKLPRTKIFKALYILVFLDIISLLLNPIFEHAVSYIYRPEYQISHYAYSMNLFYYLHLVLTYGMVVGIVGILIIQTINSAKEFKAVYYKPLFWVILLVVLNAVFLFRKGNSLFDLVDISIVGYSVILIIIYFSFFTIGQRDVKKELALKVFDTMDKYIFVFDENKALAMRNKLTDSMIQSLELPKTFTLHEFIEKSGIPIYKPYRDQKESFSLFSKFYDYDFQILMDQYKISGYVIVISSQENIKDSLTDCYYPEYLDTINIKSLLKRGKPLCVTTFNIYSLGIINTMFSYRQGNEAIVSLVESIKSIFPENSLLIRCQNATIAVITFGLKEKEIAELADEVKSIYSGKIYYVSLHVDNERASVTDYINIACTRLLMSKNYNKQYTKVINSMISYYSELSTGYLHIIERLIKISRMFSSIINLNEEQQKNLETLILSSEIGMIGLPESLILKSNPTPEEKEVLEEHTIRGYKISFTDRKLREISEDILHHHENYDGSGYPNGLKGDDIPFIARIYRIIYDFDYLINNDSNDIETVIDILASNCGIIYDPDITAAFIRFVNNNFDLFKSIYTK